MRFIGVERRIPLPAVPGGNKDGFVGEAPFAGGRRGKREGWGFFARLLNLRQKIGEQAIAARAATRINFQTLEIVGGESDAEFFVDVFDLIGGEGAEKIVAINSDPKAPIFKVADVGIVGNYLKVVPELIAQLKKRVG